MKRLVCADLGVTYREGILNQRVQEISGLRPSLPFSYFLTVQIRPPIQC
jgi:hypothetical protein